MDDSGKLITQYKQAALLHGRATTTGDYQAGNQQYDQLAEMYSALKSKGTAALASLSPLLQDEDDSVACWAATHLLPYQEPQAIATLTRVAATSGITGFTAAITLQEWQAGRLKLD
jgi:hypothetical protein